MKIKLRKDVVCQYLKQLGIYEKPEHDWLEILRFISGRELDVDTEYLFKSSFTAKMPKEGLKLLNEGVKYIHIGDELVEEVINDIRHLYKRCGNCGKSIEKESNKCLYCCSEEMMELLI